MARWLRLIEKKRGDRRTGSKLQGTIGEAGFFAAMFLLGAVALVVLVASAVTQRWPAAEYFPEIGFHQTTCVVKDKQLRQQDGADGQVAWRPELLIEYEVGGQTHRIWTYDLAGGYSADRPSQQEWLDQYVVGQPYSCWYDPTQPTRVIVRRSSLWVFWLAVAMLGSFVVIGAGGAILATLHARTSAERRAVIVKRAGDLAPVQDDRRTALQYPAVPLDANYTNSPGVMLPYRLPVTDSPGWKLLAAVVFCLVWNGVTLVLVTVAVSQHLLGNPEWLLSLVTLGALAVGGWSLYFAGRQLWLATGIGPTTLEVADHPLWPGRCYEVFLSQMGQLRIDAICVRLTCEEEATFRQGTDIRTERRRVFEQEVFRCENGAILPGKPFEREFSLSVPQGVMHSFKSANNAVLWSLAVEIEAARWPRLRRTFPIVVLPEAPLATPRSDAASGARRGRHRPRVGAARPEGV